MKLEDEVKVGQFRNPRHKLTVNLMYTYNWMTARLQTVFRNHGITNQQYNILRILRGQFPAPSTIQLLKERMLDKQPDASRLVDRLHVKGLVGRTVNKDDRRKMDVVISEEGLVLLKKMDEEVNDFENVSGQLSDKEVVQINDLLDRMRDQP